jgi:hypothetical protein
MVPLLAELIKRPCGRDDRTILERSVKKAPRGKIERSTLEEKVNAEPLSSSGNNAAPPAGHLAGFRATAASVVSKRKVSDS